MSKGSIVNVGHVATFAHVEPSKEQALKVLEEAAEVFGAWQLWDEVYYDNSRKFAQVALLNECAEVIQATCNLVSAYGVSEFRPRMADCRLRNEERGRM